MTGPSYVLTVQALSAAGRKMAAADDGRGVRGARVEARNALVRAGHEPAQAQALAEAMQRVAAGVRKIVRQEAVRAAGGDSLIKGALMDLRESARHRDSWGCQ